MHFITKFPQLWLLSFVLFLAYLCPCDMASMLVCNILNETYLFCGGCVTVMTTFLTFWTGLIAENYICGEN